MVSKIDMTFKCNARCASFKNNWYSLKKLSISPVNLNAATTNNRESRRCVEDRRVIFNAFHRGLVDNGLAVVLSSSLFKHSSKVTFLLISEDLERFELV
jgi:hypothetical protein